ncbi:MAG TPA: enoyl-CoA hydratase-related protein [Candidatus Binatia bacterium]|nr:enoyl-CoA hydratase-related protein [Candidatus Binatia bacterium]
MEDPSYEQMVADARGEDRALVEVERDPGRACAIVRLDDAERLNPLSAALTVQLLDRLAELASDPHVRTIVLTGRDPAFCAGGDLRAMTGTVHGLVDRGEAGATAMWRWIRYQFGGVVRLISRTDKVFVAALNGAAAGVGLAFALACDLIVASERARLVLAFGPIGLLPEVGTSWLLTRRLGVHKTFELFLSGQVLSAADAHRLGLANEVVPHQELLQRAGEWAERVLRFPAHGVAMTKPLLRAAADATWDQSLAMEEFAEPMCFTTRAHRDGVRAMLDKRSRR